MKRYIKKISRVEENIWGYRVQFGSNSFRILCFFDESKIVLTHGFVKKTRRTPKAEMERAIDYKRDYFKRRDTNE